MVSVNKYLRKLHTPVDGVSEMREGAEEANNTEVDRRGEQYTKGINTSQKSANAVTIYPSRMAVVRVAPVG